MLVLFVVVGCRPAAVGDFIKEARVCRRWWQEAQLPQRNNASAAHIEGLGPPAHSPSAPSGYTYAYGRIRKPQRTYVKRAVH